MNPAAVTTLAAGQQYSEASFVMANGVTLAHYSVDENGRTGSESTWVFEGAYYDIKAQQGVCRSYGVFQMSLTRIENSNRYRLTAVFPYNEQGGEFLPLLGVFELDIEMQQPSIYSSPKLRGMLPDKYIAAVARIVANFEAGDYAMTASGGGKDAGWTAALADVKAAVPTTSNYQARALQLFASVAAYKTDSFIEYYNVFKRTLTAALPIQVTASNVGKGQIWTTAELAAFEDINPAGFFQLDASSLWLKSPPVITATARQKTAVQYSYTEIRNANALVYDAFGAAQLLFASPTELPSGS